MLKSSEYSVVLLEPLEIMVSNDDSVVRDKAIASLMRVGSHLDPETDIKTTFLPLLKRLRKGDLFSMKIAACHLYANIYQKITEEETRKMICKKLDKLSKDDTPMVRRGAAMSIPRIANFLTDQQAREFLLPMTRRLLEDQNDSVKIYAVQSSVQVAAAVKDSDVLQESLLPVFRNAGENRYSWRLRFAIAENASSMAEHVDRHVVDTDILGLYELLLRDNEPEVRSEAVYRVPAVAKYCSPELMVEKILPIIRE